MTGNGGGWTLIAQGGSTSCSGMVSSASMRDTDSCSYLPYSSVQLLAAGSSSVRLHVGYGSSNFGSWSETALSTNSLAVQAFNSPAGTWHNGATWDNWSWNWSCSTGWANGWPNMHQACANGLGVHWLIGPPAYYHDKTAGGSAPRSQISATWLR